MIQREYYQRVESHKPIIDSLLNSILTYIDTLNKSHRQNNNVEAIRQIITENFSNPNFSVSDAYEQLYINSDYARRLFLKETGTTPSNMLRQLRIRKAKELLETSDKKFSIYEIAQQCGFKDQYYFSKAFKQTTGVSPNVWKKCHIQGF